MESLRKYQIYLFKNQGAWASYNILPIPLREVINMSANPREKVYAKRYNKGDRKRYKRRKEMENEVPKKENIKMKSLRILPWYKIMLWAVLSYIE